MNHIPYAENKDYPNSPGDQQINQVNGKICFKDYEPARPWVCAMICYLALGYELTSLDLEQRLQAKFMWVIC